jgi:hypothetical protein
MIEACQLKSMGVTNELIPMKEFDPEGFITKAQIATLVSRIVRGEKYLAQKDQSRWENHVSHMVGLQLMQKGKVERYYTR